MKTSYAVVSPKGGWKPSAKGTKDIVLESEPGRITAWFLFPRSTMAAF